MKTIAVPISENRKTGPVAATYAPQQSCPPSCPLFGAGCYAEKGAVAFHTRRLNEATPDEATPEEIARDEARAIRDRLIPLFGLPLRLHVVGDSTTNKAASIIAKAARRYRSLGGGRAWTYTHAWREVRRSSWRGVSTFASVHTIEEAIDALNLDFAPARVVEDFPNGDRAWKEDGITWIPCPQQTRAIPCTACKLCFDSDKLRDRFTGIAFRKH